MFIDNVVTRQGPGQTEFLVGRVLGVVTGEPWLSWAEQENDGLRSYERLEASSLTDDSPTLPRYTPH